MTSAKLGVTGTDHQVVIDSSAGKTPGRYRHGSTEAKSRLVGSVNNLMGELGVTSARSGAVIGIVDRSRKGRAMAIIGEIKFRDAPGRRRSPIPVGHRGRVKVVAQTPACFDTPVGAENAQSLPQIADIYFHCVGGSGMPVSPRHTQQVFSGERRVRVGGQDAQ